MAAGKVLSIVLLAVISAPQIAQGQVTCASKVGTETPGYADLVETSLLVPAGLGGNVAVTATCDIGYSGRALPQPCDAEGAAYE